MSEQIFKLSRLKYIIKTLRQFRKDREEFIESCTVKEWKEWATTPQFYLHWMMANVKPNLASDMAIYVLKHDTQYHWFDIADTIRAVYTDPEKWVLDESNSLKSMLATYGQPE